MPDFSSSLSSYIAIYIAIQEWILDLPIFYSLLLITRQTAQPICLGCKSQMHIVTIIYYNYKLQVYNKLRRPIMITKFITLQVTGGTLVQ